MKGPTPPAWDSQIRTAQSTWVHTRSRHGRARRARGCGAATVPTAPSRSTTPPSWPSAIRSAAASPGARVWVSPASASAPTASKGLGTGALLFARRAAGGYLPHVPPPSPLAGGRRPLPHGRLRCPAVLGHSPLGLLLTMALSAGTIAMPVDIHSLLQKVTLRARSGDGPGCNGRGTGGWMRGSVDFESQGSMHVERARRCRAPCPRVRCAALRCLRWCPAQGVGGGRGDPGGGLHERLCRCDPTQIGGSHVAVIGILSNPNTDPHTYESSTDVPPPMARGATLVVQNGLGYDDFHEQAGGSASQTNPARGLRTWLPPISWAYRETADNPHIWYQTRPTCPAVSAEIARRSLTGRVQDPADRARRSSPKNRPPLSASLPALEGQPDRHRLEGEALQTARPWRSPSRSSATRRMRSDCAS